MTKANVFLLNTDSIGRKASDEELVQNILAGATADFEVLMSRNNQRLYRVCRSVVANGAEAEAALQEAYLRAYRNLGQFTGDSTFVIWMTKLAVYEALQRLRPQLVSKQRGAEERPTALDPTRLLEDAIDSLPSNYRTVFVLRHIEQLSAEETAACLLLSREAVEARLLRASRMLLTRVRPGLLNQAAPHVFAFRGARNTELIERVAARVAPRADQMVAAP